MNKNEVTNLLEVHPKRTRTIKGSIDIKNTLYFEVKEKAVTALKKNEKDRTAEDEVAIENYKKLSNLQVSLNSFIPEEYLKKLHYVQYRGQKIYHDHCISDTSPYMTLSSLDAFKNELQEVIEECMRVVDEIISIWDEIQDIAVDTVITVCEGKITDEQARNLIKKAMPTVAAFRESYLNCFCYEQKKLTDNVIVFNAMTGQKEEGLDYYVKELDNIIYQQLMEVCVSLDNILVSKMEQELDFSKTTKPRLRLNSALKRIRRLEAWTSNSYYKKLGDKIQEIIDLTCNDALYEESEILEFEILKHLSEDNMIPTYPSELEYMNEAKYDEFLNQIKSLNYPQNLQLEI